MAVYGKVPPSKALGHILDLTKTKTFQYITAYKAKHDKWKDAAIACSIPLAASVTLAAWLRTISAKGWWHKPYGNDAASVEITEGFPESSVGKESTCNAEDPSSIPGSGKSPGGGNGNPLQYSCLENPHGQRSLAGYGPWGRKELHHD